MAIVITHDRLGVYVGHCMGLGFWSMLDMAGQDHVVVFPSRHDAIEHVRGWDDCNDPSNYSFVDVRDFDGESHVSVDRCIRAGLEKFFVAIEEGLNCLDPYCA